MGDVHAGSHPLRPKPPHTFPKLVLSRACATSRNTQAPTRAQETAGSQCHCVCSGITPGTRLPRVPAPGGCHSGSAPLDTWGACRGSKQIPSTLGVPWTLQPFTLCTPPWDSALPVLSSSRCRMGLDTGSRDPGARSHALALSSYCSAHAAGVGGGQDAVSCCRETSLLGKWEKEQREPPAEAKPQSYRPRGAALWGEGFQGDASMQGGSLSPQAPSQRRASRQSQQSPVT